MRHSFWKTFGPGLLWAGASIGVSHLVQSTRAGANAGFALAGIILLALILKYPFFEYGPRYAAAAGESLVEGYERVGKWALWLYLAITVATSLIVQVAVVLFTAFLLNHVLGTSVGLAVMGGVVCAGAAVLLWLGRYKYLDWTIKLVLALLAVSTLVAAAVTLPEADFSSFAILPGRGVLELGFLLALVGWMPTAIDLSVWSSLWTLAKDEVEDNRSSVDAARLDFNIGYVGTGILAFAFLTLGATVMYQSGQTFSPSGTVFSTQLLDLYVATLGAWTGPVVMVALVTTMVSTSITVVDGFPRAIDRTVQVLRGKHPRAGALGDSYWIALIALAVLTVGVLGLFLGSLTTMVDFATIVSFLTAPILGYLNLRVVTSRHMPAEHRPGTVMRWLSYAGLLLLAATGLFWMVARFSQG